jgi:sulfide:quinone oxidoreductase
VAAQLLIVTGYGKLILAEFDYDNNPTETFRSIRQRTMEHVSAKRVYRGLYWNKF